MVPKVSTIEGFHCNYFPRYHRGFNSPTPCFSMIGVVF